MDENILFYDVHPGETLTTIAEKIGMSETQLRDFHNQHCEKMETLWFNNLVGIKQIIVPKEYKNPEEFQKEKNKNFSKKIDSNFYYPSYSVTEFISNPYQKDIEINYEVEISKNDADNIVGVKYSNFKKDQTTPDDKMSSIALACMESIYPISFTLNNGGGIFGIHEFKSLKKRFEKKLPDLQSFFVGEIYEDYFNTFSKKLEDEDTITKQLTSTLLHQFLFPKLHWFTKLNDWNEKFYLLQDSFEIDCIFSNDSNYSHNDIVETKMKGTVNEAVSLRELIKGNRDNIDDEIPLEATIEIIYNTDRTKKKLKSGEINILLHQDGELYKKHQIKISQNEKS